MAYKIQWFIQSLSRELASGYVYKVHFIVKASCDTTGATFQTQGSQILERPNILVPYEDLSEEMVLQWIYEALGEDQVKIIESEVLNGLSVCITYNTSSDFPWLDKPSEASATIQKDLLLKVD